MIRGLIPIGSCCWGKLGKMMLQHEVYRFLDSICSSCHDMCKMLFPASLQRSNHEKNLQPKWELPYKWRVFLWRIIYTWAIFHGYVTNKQRVTAVHGVPAVVSGCASQQAAPNSSPNFFGIVMTSRVLVGCSSGVFLGVSP